MYSTWQSSELQRYLDENKQDALLNSKTVFLSNPQQREELDGIILNQIWPGVVRALQNSPITTLMGMGLTLREGIKEKKHVYTTSALTFLLQDPERPKGPDSDVPWYCRGTIECSPLDYMISFDFIVHFPEEFSVRKILRLLKDPIFAGCPPELTYSESAYNGGLFSVAFTKGSGAGWGIRTYNEAGKHMYAEVKKNLKVIKAVYNLEQDYGNTKKFNELHRALVEAYEAH